MASVVHVYCWLRIVLDPDQHVSAYIQEGHSVLGGRTILKSALDESRTSGLFVHAMWLVVPLGESISHRGGFHQSKKASGGGI